MSAKIEINLPTKNRICAINHSPQEFMEHYASGIFSTWKNLFPEESFVKSLQGIRSDANIIVFAGNSVGETLFFAGQLSRLNDFYPQKLSFTCDSRLEPLIKRTFPHLHLIPNSKLFRFHPEISDIKVFSDLPRIDLSPLMSNKIFRHVIHSDHQVWTYNIFSDMMNTLKEAPPSTPLKWDEEQATEWSEKLSPYKDKILVGICWRSGLHFVDTLNHIFSLDDLRPLFENDKIQLINLQYTGLEKEEEDLLEQEFPGKLLSFPKLDLNDDLDGTAALMSQLDYIVSIPNSTGTLAAAIGSKTYLLSFCQPGYFVCTKDSPASVFFPNAENCWPEFEEESSKRAVVYKILNKILSDKGII